MQAKEGIMTVRPECPQDYAAIEEVSRVAFGQDDEARLVARLRQLAGFNPGLLLVAVRDDVVVGHILFSPIVIASEADEVPALALAPMAVLPALQRTGIGSQLVAEGLAACRRAGHRIVIVVGHPDYYPRFGFTRAGPLGLKAPFPEHIVVRELRYRVRRPGFRTRSVTLVTTLLDPEIYPAEALPPLDMRCSQLRIPLSA